MITQETVYTVRGIDCDGNKYAKKATRLDVAKESAGWLGYQGYSSVSITDDKGVDHSFMRRDLIEMALFYDETIC